MFTRHNINVQAFRIRKFIDIALREGVSNYAWNVYSSMKHRKLRKVHVIGDSHTGMFRFSPYFVVHHLGPITAYNLGSGVSLTNSRKQLEQILHGLQKGTALLFVAGEIDCRLHIYNQFKRNNEQISLNELLSKTVDRYVEVMKECALRGFNVSVCSIAPATKQKNKYKYPYYGDTRTQIFLKREFNRLLHEKCEQNKIGFIDLYSDVVNDDGFTKDEFQADEVHLKRCATKFVVPKIFGPSE